MSLRWGFVIAFLLLGLSEFGPIGLAAEDHWRKPLSNRNQFPPAFLFIYLKPERATVLTQQEASLTFSFDYSNIIVFQSDERESLLLDSEYLSTEIRFRMGLPKRLEIGAAIPFYVLYGGFLDSLISDFHKAFDFPNSTREQTPDNLFQYHYRIDDASVLESQQAPTALGDITVQVKKALLENSPWELAVRGAVKLPSGSRKDLSGSGKTDFGIGLAASRVGRRFGGYFNLNYHFLGKPDGLDTRNYLSFVTAVDWRFKPALAALLQYEQLEPFLNSHLPVLDQSARQIGLGLRWRRSERSHFEWRFAEDLSSTAPDFTIAFQWTVNWSERDAAEAKGQ